MAAIFDTVFDAIKTKLEEYSSELDESLRFSVYADYYRTLPNDGIAAVFVYLGPLDPEQDTGSRCEYETEYILELVTWGKATKSIERAGEAAAARLRYLIDQVLSALYDSDEMNLGLDPGTFGRKGFPRVTPLDIPSSGSERAACACRLSWTLATPWEAADQTGTAIEYLSVIADKWSVLLEPDEEDE